MFGNDKQGDEYPMNGGRYAVQSYMEYQGDKLVDRFDAGTFVALCASSARHDVGRGRGGVRKALRGCPVPVVVGGITSDRLHPLRLQEEVAELLPGCTGLQVVESIYGHDAFLMEFEAVSDMIRKTLELAENEGA
jgi:homoserine O-acetyltransferase